MARQAARFLFLPYTRHEWRVAIALFISYIVVYVAAASVLPASTGLRPAVSIALVALFFGTLRLWPVVYIAALIGAVLVGGSPLLAIIAMPISATVQAVIGAYLLRRARIDPLFRRYRDMFSLGATVILIAALLPTTALIVSTILGTPFTAASWGRFYVASAFCFLILTPLLLRWLAKPRFSRTQRETVELLAVFGLLTLISTELFMFRVSDMFGISLIYLLLIPLFWIALRLRPRFVTLALFIVSLFGIASVMLNGTPEALSEQLMSMELLLIVIATIFLTITSIEEDRRVNTNLMLSQLATLENAVARISSESRAKNDFIAILAHELRNPLAPIVSAIELLKLKGPRDEEDAELLAMMENRMEVVRRLLDDLLDISRISEGKIALKREPIELLAVIDRAIVTTEHHRKERHQRLTLKKPAGSIMVTGDAMRLEQIFSNLLTNASKYSHSGDAIVMGIREDFDAVEIEISDNGVGLDAEEIERIFLPFEQGAEGVQSMKGLGIGLALVRSFVEMHGGTIAAKSRGKGLGSSFVVRLPMQAASAETKGILVGIASMIASFDTEGLSVLIVDDNDAAAGSMGRLLELQGCRVSYAYNGTDAIREALRLLPQVVLLDVGLPDIDGYRVASELRAQGFAGRLIALTGYSTDEAKQKGAAAGFDEFLVKPTSLTDLRKAIPELS